jgi:hypothetical protein
VNPCILTYEAKLALETLALVPGARYRTRWRWETFARLAGDILGEDDVPAGRLEVGDTFTAISSFTNNEVALNDDELVALVLPDGNPRPVYLVTYIGDVFDERLDSGDEPFERLFP